MGVFHCSPKPTERCAKTDMEPKVMEVCSDDVPFQIRWKSQVPAVPFLGGFPAESHQEMKHNKAELEKNGKTIMVPKKG